MYKILCNACEKEPVDNNFMFAAEVMEVTEVYDLTNRNLNAESRKQMKKSQVHLCRDCYNKYLKDNLKI